MAGDTVRGDVQSGRITLPFTRLAVLRSAVLQLFSVHTTCWTIDSIHTLHFHQEKLENNLVSSGPKKKKKTKHVTQEMTDESQMIPWTNFKLDIYKK